MSSAPNYIQLHIGDYLRDTGDLSLLQHGAYYMLMMSYYASGKPLPNDTHLLCRRIHAFSAEERAAVDHVLGHFFVLQGPVWMHKRIESELSKWREKTQKAQQSADARWKKASENSEDMDANAMRTQCVGNASLVPSPNTLKPKPSRASADAQVGFDAFWKAYPRKKSKAAAMTAWIKLKPEHPLVERILQAVEGAKHSADWLRDGGRFIPYPATWLNAGGWDDEPEPPRQRRAVV